MKIIIPLGGLGRRFQECGYNRPKPLVRALGKELIFWVLDSLKLEKNDELYIPYNEMLDRHKFGEILNLKYPEAQIFPIPQTKGASETIKNCIDHFKIKGRIAVLDGDTWYEDDIIGLARGLPGNLVAHFHSTTPEPIYSYIRTSGELIKDIREKEKISDMANSGCYVFEDAEFFSHSVSNMDLDRAGETYTSQVIAKMISAGSEFRTFKVNKFHILGTPEQVIKFSKSHESPSKRFCFDLDNTLVTSPRISGDYSTVEPIADTINYLRRLKKQGHTIIIYTARRMRTHSGNVGAVISDVSEVTMETLRRFGIPHDEVHFGKPYAHFYVDDLMVNPRSDMNKELGFYTEDVKPRHFNKVDKGKTFRKTSTNKKKIAAEAFYHKWVEDKSPREIQDMFPKIIGHGDGWLETELIRGLDFSTLYLNQILKKDTLVSLLSNLDRLHMESESKETHQFYENFSPKLLSRLSMYDYNSLGFDEQKKKNLVIGLDNIVSEGFKRVMIHGDPVFSNVILDWQNKVKFVDMRGAEGDKITIYGHPLYDFAKVYQSLSGYDEILLDKSVDKSYKQTMIKCFEEKFDYDILLKIKTIAASLLLSLIPLHDETDKHARYVKLAISII